MLVLEQKNLLWKIMILPLSLLCDNRWSFIQTHAVVKEKLNPALFLIDFFKFCFFILCSNAKYPFSRFQQNSPIFQLQENIMADCLRCTLLILPDSLNLHCAISTEHSRCSQSELRFDVSVKYTRDFEDLV